MIEYPNSKPKKLKKLQVTIDGYFTISTLNLHNNLIAKRSGNPNRILCSECIWGENEVNKVRITKKGMMQLEADEWDMISVDVKKGEILRLFCYVDDPLDEGLDENVYVLSDAYVFDERFHREHAYFKAERGQTVNVELEINRSEKIDIIFDNEFSLFTGKDIDFTIQVLTPEKDEPAKKAHEDIQTTKPLQSIQLRKPVTRISWWIVPTISILIAIIILIPMLFLIPWLLPIASLFIAIVASLINISNWLYRRKSSN